MPPPAGAARDLFGGVLEGVLRYSGASLMVLVGLVLTLSPLSYLYLERTGRLPWKKDSRGIDTAPGS